MSRYIKGFWCEILEEGLERRLCEDQSAKNIKKAVLELFDEILPKYVKENASGYPECYQILKMHF